MWARNIVIFFSIPILFCLASLKGKKSNLINIYLLYKNFRHFYISKVILLKFVYSKKAARFRRYLPIYFDVTEYVLANKINWEIIPNFLNFSEYLIFRGISKQSYTIVPNNRAARLFFFWNLSH